MLSDMGGRSFGPIGGFGSQNHEQYGGFGGFGGFDSLIIDLGNPG